MSPNVDGTVVPVGDTRNWTTHWRGVSPEYFAIKRWTFASGGAFSTEDVERADDVCVLGETVRRQLFGDKDPVGETLRIGSQPFRVVGLLVRKGQSASGSDQDDTLVVPYTTAIKKIRGNGQMWLDDVLCSAWSPEDIAPAAKAIQALLHERHHLWPEQDDDFNIRHPEELVKAEMEEPLTSTDGAGVGFGAGGEWNDVAVPGGGAPVSFGPMATGDRVLTSGSGDSSCSEST